MNKRAFILVMDSFGIGAAPDAARFGDEAADTLGHIAQACASGNADRAGVRYGTLHTPNLEALGLGLAAELARFEEAVQSLGTAEAHVLAGMNRLMHARTLDYTTRAATPAEAFELELARHRGLMDLVPLAIRDLNPRTDARVLVDRYAEASAALASQAQILAKAGDLPAAQATLGNALLYVQRALTSAGLVIPQPTGN